MTISGITQNTLTTQIFLRREAVLISESEPASKRWRHVMQFPNADFHLVKTNKCGQATHPSQVTIP